MCIVSWEFPADAAPFEVFIMITWNLTKDRHKYDRFNILVLSIKSGRTWFRVLLNKYLSLHYSVPFETTNLTKYNETIPSIGYTHEMWKHYSMANLSQYISGKFIIPKNVLMRKKIILLCRDPRDTVVSLYFQKSKRSRNRVVCDISTFIRHRRFGIRSIVNVMNKWYERLKEHPDCLVLSYEELRADTLGTLIKVLRFVGVTDVNIPFAKEAVEFARFENMKAMEARGDFNKRHLQPGDPTDPDSFKVREGKVGGYKRYFSKEDLEYINDAMTYLDVSYGYKPEKLQ